jgi:hypothetical protein
MSFTPRYSWDDVAIPESVNAEERLNVEIKLTIPELISLSMAGRRDGALAELLAERRVSVDLVGTTWRVDTGAPSDSLGDNGDFYINTATSDVYYKASGTYSIIGNIGVSAPSSGMQYATKTLNNAEIKNWPTAVQYTVVPAPAVASQILVPVSVYLAADTFQLGYSDINAAASLQILVGGENTPFAIYEAADNWITGLLGAATCQGLFLPAVPSLGTAGPTQALALAGPPSAQNAPITAQFLNGMTGNLTGGDAANWLTITVAYMTVESPGATCF